MWYFKIGMVYLIRVVVVVVMVVDVGTSTGGSNPGLLDCSQILYQLSHKEKPKNTGMGSLLLFQWIFPIHESNCDLLHCRRILYQELFKGSNGKGYLVTQESLHYVFSV